MKPKVYKAQHRCIPCGRGSWDILPHTTAYATPICCNKPMVPTGRIECNGQLLTLVTKYRRAA